MSQATPNLPDDVRQRIDDHLDRIERVLIRGDVSRIERRSIVDEVETQIYEMLAARAGEDPAVAVSQILAGLDGPEAYARDTGPAAVATSNSQENAAPSQPHSWWQRARQWWSVRPEMRRLSPPALLAACWAGTAILLTLCALSFRSPPVLLFALLFLVGLTAPVGVTVLGFLAVRRIRRGSNESGMPLALLETFFFPILFANLALIGVLAVGEEAALVLLAGLVILAANIGLARYAWRRFGDQFLRRVDSV
ncbi:MAG TPA: hypothetical protein VHC22_04560 [Pirellulales bacterium]|nr:hypothetical protein [Pirellulales bacterium]